MWLPNALAISGDAKRRPLQRLVGRQTIPQAFCRTIDGHSSLVWITWQLAPARRPGADVGSDPSRRS